MKSTAWQVPQVPDQHVSPAEQTLPHVPQLLASVCLLTQADPHIVNPGAHPQLPFWQLRPDPHAEPQPPQLSGSVSSFTHVPLQSVSRPWQAIPLSVLASVDASSGESFEASSPLPEDPPLVDASRPPSPPQPQGPPPPGTHKVPMQHWQVPAAEHEGAPSTHAEQGFETHCPPLDDEADHPELPPLLDAPEPPPAELPELAEPPDPAPLLVDDPVPLELGPATSSTSPSSAGGPTT